MERPTDIDGRSELNGNPHAGRENGGPPGFMLRDLLAVGFRRRRLIAISFLTVFLPVATFVLLRPEQYEAQMKILVKRERLDPLVTSEESAQRPFWLGVTEEELNSEAELLRSRDLLAEVVVAARPSQDGEPGVLSRLRAVLGGWWEEPAAEGQEEVASDVRRLARQLEIKPLRKSNIIQVNYASPDPEMSAAVLRTLADRYLAKHLEVHRPSGAFDFFERETERYGTQLELAQARLTQQNQEEGLISVEAESENALRRLGELEGIEDETQSRIAETAGRLRVLEAQLATTPPRTTTEIHIGSVRLLEDLHSSLVALEMKIIDLRRDFQPDYPALQELEAQRAALRAAITEAEGSPLREETTDQNPTYGYLLTELAKSRAELAGLRAHAAATAQSLSLLRAKARRLEDIGMVQKGLVRASVQAEQSYLSYARKREEARIADALDAQRILNVAIAEEPTVLFEPPGSRKLLLLLLGAVCSGIVGVGLACASEYRDTSYRTPGEIESSLGHPVLATMPALPSKPWRTP